ncbi:MAG: carboxypeptidase regulatory-like domain-containing protein [Actinomycetales bacterium]|nr:MAG: carboxypeptidase regulatory-like domain-containing protein [Actinomycetales bacterium]
MPEYSTSYRYGYVKRNPPKGYKGWMYRDVCKAVGAGKYVLITVGAGDRTVDVTNPRGGTISGRVTRVGGKSNKEMLVTAYSTDGKKVLRSAYSSRSGGFVIRGLASGSYKIVVNADSWRGISRSFSGKKSVKAKAGKNVSAGTLRFKG